MEKINREESSPQIYSCERPQGSPILYSLEPEAEPQKVQKTVLLHSCCGPCSTACIERVLPEYQVTVFYFNPCITESEEYERRKAAQIQCRQE